MSCGCSVKFSALDSYAFAHFALRPNARGLVRWLGMNWRGLPMPLRVWFLIRVAYRGHAFDFADGLEQFAGCGCIDRLKAIAEKHGSLV